MMRPPNQIVTLPNAQHPKVIANFMEFSRPLKSNPMLSKEDVIRSDVVKQVTTAPTQFRMLPLLDPFEFQTIRGAFDLKATKVVLPKKREFPMCTMVHQFE